MGKELKVGKFTIGENETFDEAIEKIKAEWDNLTNSEKNEVVEFFEFGNFCKYDRDENGLIIIKEKHNNVRVDVLIEKITANSLDKKEKDEFFFGEEDFSRPDALRRTIIHLHSKYGNDIDGVYQVIFVYECKNGKCRFSDINILVFDEGKIVYLAGVDGNDISTLDR